MVAGDETYWIGVPADIGPDCAGIFDDVLQKQLSTLILECVRNGCDFRAAGRVAVWDVLGIDYYDDWS